MTHDGLHGLDSPALMLGAGLVGGVKGELKNESLSSDFFNTKYKKRKKKKD